MSTAETGSFSDGCVLGKAHRKPFTPWSDRSQGVGELIHADVNGPMSLKSLRGTKNYMCFKNDYRNFLHQATECVSRCLCSFPDGMSTADQRKDVPI
jgi:hypothetical protein